MEIVLNEAQWVEDALANMTLGTRPSETLGRLARYYYSIGYKRSEIAGMLEDFVLRCNPTANIVKWQSIIDARVRNADKFALIAIQSIVITKGELDKIRELPGVLLQKLMFTLLCLAKYGNAVNSKNNNWVNRDAREVFTLSNITVTVKRQALMFNDLWKADYIGYSRIVDNINVNVKIVEHNETDVGICITDYRNLGNQYLQYTGGDFMACQNCGAVVKRNSGRQKYCRDCAADIHLQKTIESRKTSIA